MILLLVIDSGIEMVTAVQVAPDMNKLVQSCHKCTANDGTIDTLELYSLLMDGDRFEVSKDLGNVIKEEEIEDLEGICWYFL